MAEAQHCAPLTLCAACVFLYFDSGHYFLVYVLSVRAAFFLYVHANVTNGNGTHSTCRISGGCCCGDRDAFFAYVFGLVL